MHHSTDVLTGALEVTLTVAWTSRTIVTALAEVGAAPDSRCSGVREIKAYIYKVYVLQDTQLYAAREVHRETVKIRNQELS